MGRRHDPAAVAEARLRRRAAKALMESIDVYDRYVDPRERYEDPTGELWTPVGAEHGKAVGFSSEQELAEARRLCRTLAEDNDFAINGIDNRINFVVGTGHRYQPTVIKGRSATDKELDAVKEVIDDWIEANDWHNRQQESRRRLDRDGESFLRIFESPDMIIVRAVEPAQVYTPTNYTEPYQTFGVTTAPKDVESIAGYFIDEEPVPAAEIQHRKANVDRTSKRGKPTIWASRRSFDRAGKLLRNMSVVAATQASIAMIRRHKGASPTQIGAISSANAAYRSTNTATGETTKHRRYRPGTIIDASANTDYDFPIVGVSADRMVAILQAELRAIAARLNMPEYMLTADASNGNYASTMVAGGPAHRNFQVLQASTMTADLQLLRRVIRHAIAAGRLPEDIERRVYIAIEPPKIDVVNRIDDARANQILHQERIISRSTWRAREDLDDDTEQANIDREREADADFIPPAISAAAATPDDGNQDDSVET